MNPALIVFAKAPQPGQVKTRLTELLTGAEAAALYEAFLEDALAQYAAFAEKHDAALRLYHTGAEWPAHLTPQGASLHRQQGEGLDERMTDAFRETFTAGASAALILGTDHPTLPPAFVQKGLEILRDGDRQAVCIGPSRDGGFYLLGMNRFQPALFEVMTYSHDAVFAETLARAAGTGATPVVLPEWYDVDRPADLRRLANELAACATAAPRTSKALRGLHGAYPTLPLAAAPSAK